MKYILILFIIFAVSCSRKPKEEEKESRKEEIVAKSEQVVAELDRELKKQKGKKPVVRGEVKKAVKSRGAVRKRKKKKEIIYPPKIEYISYSFEELKGKKNKVIDAGDRIRLNIKVKNTGRGPTSATSAKVSTPDKIVIAMTEVILPYIAPGDTKTFPLDINIPSIAPGSAKVILEFSEGSKAELSFKIKARQKTRHQKKIEKDKQRLDKKRDKRFEDLDKEIGY